MTFRLRFNSTASITSDRCAGGTERVASRSTIHRSASLDPHTARMISSPRAMTTATKFPVNNSFMEVNLT